jgi:DNA-binding NarL/FixJ family response regulator
MPRGTTDLYQDGAMGLATVVPAQPLVAANMTSGPSKLRGRRFSDETFAFSSSTVALVLVGGQRLLRDATASLLTAQDGLTVLGTFETTADLLSAGSECRPSLVLLDCDGDDPDGCRGAVEALSSAHPSLRIVMLCQEVSEEVVRCAIEHRVSGVILKSYSMEDIRTAIGYMATGRTIMPADWQRVAAPPRQAQLGLSPRHCEILTLIAQGRRNEEIAGELGISPNTIKFHLRAIYSRLEVRNRAEAAHRYGQLTGGAS